MEVGGGLNELRATQDADWLTMQAEEKCKRIESLLAEAADVSAGRRVEALAGSWSVARAAATASGATPGPYADD